MVCVCAFIIRVAELPSPLHLSHLWVLRNLSGVVTGLS